MSEIYIARGDRLAARRLENETMILCPEDSGLYVLNELGTALWEAADGQTPLTAIVDEVICRDFDVDAATALADAREFVEGLERRRVLRVAAVPFSIAEGTQDSK